MKKLIPLLALLVPLAACGDDEPAPGNNVSITENVVVNDGTDDNGLQVDAPVEN